MDGQRNAAECNLKVTHGRLELLQWERDFTDRTECQHLWKERNRTLYSASEYRERRKPALQPAAVREQRWERDHPRPEIPWEALPGPWGTTLQVNKYVNQVCGAMTFWFGSGSGSGDPCLWLMDPDPAIFVIELQDANKKKFLIFFFVYNFLKVGYLYIIFKDKKSKKITK